MTVCRVDHSTSAPNLVIFDSRDTFSFGISEPERMKGGVCVRRGKGGKVRIMTLEDESGIDGKAR